ncbi:hypothetical protein Halar_3307 [halophilic archaeon DL31]|nr:hypothetical protein Halar_3307 [halophilic archaeon DL31]
MCKLEGGDCQPPVCKLEGGDCQPPVCKLKGGDGQPLTNTPNRQPAADDRTGPFCACPTHFQLCKQALSRFRAT